MEHIIEGHATGFRTMNQKHKQHLQHLMGPGSTWISTGCKV